MALISNRLLKVDLAHVILTDGVQLSFVHIHSTLLLQFGPQIRDVEQMHRTCASRERKLQRLCRWTEQQQNRLDQSRKPTCRAAAGKDLLELEVNTHLTLLPCRWFAWPRDYSYFLSPRPWESEWLRCSRRSRS